MADQVNTPKRLTIGSKVLSIASLSHRGELALLESLRAVIEDGLELWRKFKPSLDMLEEQQRWNDRAQLVEFIAKSIASGQGRVEFEDVIKARRTNPSVLAREIFQRAKPYHDSLELREVEAVITTANCEQVYVAMEDALSGKSDPKAIPSP